MTTLTLEQPSFEPTDRLGLTLVIAAVVHGLIIIGVGFSPIVQITKTPPALEVILIDQQSDSTPEEAEYIAQTSQDGGGETDLYTRPSSPFASAHDFDTDGMAPVPMEASAPKSTPDSPDAVLTTLFSRQKENIDLKSTEIDTPDLKVSDIVVERNMEIARLSAELDTSMEEYAKRPRKTFLTARTHESSSAEYMHKWVEKVERMGNLNYPDEARRRQLFGKLILVVGIHKNGSLEEIFIRQSSGETVLDDAATRIVRMAAPFDALSGKLAEETDILYITRTWEFKSDNSIISHAN